MSKHRRHAAHVLDWPPTTIHRATAPPLQPLLSLCPWLQGLPGGYKISPWLQGLPCACKSFVLQTGALPALPVLRTSVYQFSHVDLPTWLDGGRHQLTLHAPTAVWLHKWPLGYKACPHSIHQLPCGYTGGPLVTMVAHSWMQHLPAQQQGPPRYYGPPCVCLAMWNCPLMSNIMSFDAVRGQLLVGTTWEITTHWIHHMPCGYTSGPLADVPVAPCGHM